MKKRFDYRWLRSGILAFAVIAPIWTIIFLQIDLLAALVPLFVSHLFLLYPTLVPHSQWWGPVLRSFEPSGKEVWITIDDGPTSAHTEKILDLLDRYHARATFFVIGMRAKKFPQLIEQILARGHEVSNHTFTHPSGSFWCAPPSKIFAEIDGCNDVISRGSPAPRSLFRAPAGLKNFFLHHVLRRRGMWLIGWTARGFDTSRRHPDEVAARIVKQVRPGAIILLHEGHRIETDPEYNPACIDQTLRELAERDYVFVIPQLEQLRTDAAGK
jgi:peptidoglycan/xylan/chitin deacetylase (PgdA/CDA1 family)